jgi:hypothetical protein
VPDTWKQDVETVSLALKVDGRPHFMAMLARNGLVKRMGFRSIGSSEEAVAVGRRDGLFEAFMEAVPEGLKAHRGTHEADGTDGPRCQWRIEFSGAAEVVTLDLTYHAASAGLPQVIAKLVALAEGITDEWYAAELEQRRSASPDPASAADATGSLPLPSSSRMRRILAVVLDFFLLSIPYAYLLYLLGPETSATLPLGAGLVLFAIVEIVLLQLLRWSPGYWAFGISMAPGRAPVVDPRQLARESAVTIVVAVLFLRSGIDAMSDWTVTDFAPAPYFGLDLASGVSIAFTVALGALALAAGLLILRTDMRGVWLGAAFVVISLLSFLPGDQDLWRTWAESDFTNRRAAQGRPASQEDIQSFVAMLRPLMFGVLLFLTGGLALCWSRFRSRESSEPVRAESVA